MEGAPREVYDGFTVESLPYINSLVVSIYDSGKNPPAYAQQVFSVWACSQNQRCGFSIRPLGP
jgi:hypothetical protein